MRNWTIILTFLFGIETLLIIIFLCGEMKVDANSPSVLISAFGVMVTFVVAWQIWATIDARNSIKEFEKRTKDYDADLDEKATEIKEQLKSEFQQEIDKLKKELQDRENLIYNHLSGVLYSYLRMNTPLYEDTKKPLFQFLSQSIDGLKYGLLHNDNLICHAHISQMLRRIVNAKKQGLDNTQIAELVGKLQSLSFPDNLSKKAQSLLRAIQTFNAPPVDRWNEDEVEYEESD